MQNKFKLTKNAIYIGLALTGLITTSCSTVSVNEKDSSKTIANNRGNIVTRSNLSNKSASQLLSVGMPEEVCLKDFNRCMARIDKGFLNKDNKEHLALKAELHLAKAKSIAESADCVKRIVRPPIDPYYANAPLTSEQQAASVLYLAECNLGYRDNLLHAIKNSYAYLFYDQLNPTAANSSKANISTKPNHLPTNLDIQTQDIYEAASDALIKQLYANKDSSQQADKVTSFISPELVKNAQSMTNSASNSSNGIKYGEQIKVLNFTFPPVNEDPYLAKLAGTVNEQELADNPSEENKFESSSDKGVTTSIDVYLPNEPEYLQNTETYNKSIDKLYASHDLSFSGLNSVSEREGVGISYVTLFDDRLNTSITNLIRADNKHLNSEDPLERIHLTGNLLLTGVVLPEGNTLEDVLASNNFDIKLYNPHHTDSIKILNEPYYLAANFSASYGMWLAENRLDNVGYFNLLSRQQSLILPQLFMLEPYDPNKRIIIMLHGLSSSPATWISITNDISSDSELRENYQVWQIFYPTNIPILENRYRIQELIETAYKINDPNSEHKASHNSVLIGHSMGAVIGRMLVSNENLQDNFYRLNQEDNMLRLSKLVNKQLDKENLLNRMQLKQLKSVDTAVFISAPFRGTDFADRWFTQLLRRVVHLPLGFIQTITGNLASIATEGELASNPLGALYFQNGASQLSDKSSFMKLTADLKIADNVTYHSIIANRDSDIYNGLMRLKLTTAPETQLADKKTLEPLEVSSHTFALDDVNLADVNPEENAKLPSVTSTDGNSNPAEKIEEVTSDIADSVSQAMSDGIVPYGSSHLEGAASETIIKGGHSIQDTPEAVLTLRKILHQHLKQHPIEADDQQ